MEGIKCCICKGTKETGCICITVANELLTLRKNEEGEIIKDVQG